MPEGHLDQLITRDSITQALSDDHASGGGRTGPGEEDLIKFILQSAKKLLAISLLSGLESSALRDAMELFKSNGFDDSSKLPIESLDANRLPWSCPLWTPLRLKLFQATQWQFLVPVFRKSQIRQTLEAKRILPLSLVTRERKEGAFSDVWEVKIHEAHQEEEPLSEVR